MSYRREGGRAGGAGELGEVLGGSCTLHFYSISTLYPGYDRWLYTPTAHPAINTPLKLLHSSFTSGYNPYYSYVTNCVCMAYMCPGLNMILCYDNQLAEYKMLICFSNTVYTNNFYAYAAGLQVSLCHHVAIYMYTYLQGVL